MADGCNWAPDKVSRVGGVGRQGYFEDVVLLFIRDKNIETLGLRFVFYFVFIHQVDVERRTFGIGGAYNRFAVGVLDDKLRFCRFFFREVHVIVPVFESASAIFDTGFTGGIRSCEYRDIHFLGADAHLDRNVEIPHVCRDVVLGDDILSVCVQNPFVETVKERHAGDFYAVRPDFRDESAFADVSLAGDVDGATFLVDIDMGTVGNVERGVEYHVDFVVGSLGFHFLFRRTVTPDKLVLAVNRYVRIHGGCIEVAVPFILAYARHARVIQFFAVCAGMRHPAPVARIFGQRGGSRNIGRRVPFVAFFAIKFLLWRFVHQVLVWWIWTAVVESHVKAQAARTLDDCRTQIQREVPLPCSRRFVVGVFDFDGVGIAEVSFQFLFRSLCTFATETGFVVCVADVRTHADIGVNFIGSAHVEADGQAVECPSFVVEYVDVQHGHVRPVVLICLYAKVVPRYRCRELETVVFVIDCSLRAVALDHEIVRCLFLEAANFHVVELGGNAGNVCVAGSGIIRKFGSGGVRYSIPIDFGFVFSVRSVPHDFGAIRRNVTDGDVCDFRAFDVAYCREKVRGLGAIDAEFGRHVFRLVGVCACDIEVVGCAGS